MSYQGWTNYETWAVALWIDNEEASYRYWHDRASELYEAVLTEQDPYGPEEGYNIEDARAKAVQALARVLHDEFEETMPQLKGLWADLLLAAFGEVDWYEIAKSRYDE